MTRKRATLVVAWGTALVLLAAAGGLATCGTLRASVRLALGGFRPSADASAALAGLPLHEVPASDTGTTLAVLVTGDGGWAAADRALAAALAARGVPVVALDARAYLERERSPAVSSRDLARILAHYRAAWRRRDAVVVGYSRGADLAPFMVAGLPEEERRHVALVTLLGPSRWASFSFHLVDIVANVHRPSDLPVAPEVARMGGVPVLCIAGARDRAAICDGLGPDVRRMVREGGHEIHVSDAPLLADAITRALARPRQGARFSVDQRE